MDAEYIRTGRLSTKSDVFSFGVVLLQLATDLPAVQFGRHILSVVAERYSEGGLQAVLAPVLASLLEQGEDQEGSLPGRREQGTFGGGPSQGGSTSGSLTQPVLGVAASSDRASASAASQEIEAEAGDALRSCAGGSAQHGLGGEAPAAEGEVSSRMEGHRELGGGRDAPVGELERRMLGLLLLGMGCCESNPTRRPSMYRVALSLEGLLEAKEGAMQGEEVGSGVPFPEYDRPEEKEWTATEQLSLGNTATADSPAPEA
jgi:hypothetical protein